MLNCLSGALQTRMLGIAAESYILRAIRICSPGGHHRVPVPCMAGLGAEGQNTPLQWAAHCKKSEICPREH